MTLPEEAVLMGIQSLSLPFWNQENEGNGIRQSAKSEYNF